MRRNTSPAQPAGTRTRPRRQPDFARGTDPLEAVAHRINDETTRAEMRTAIDTTRIPKEHNP